MPIELQEYIFGFTVSVESILILKLVSKRFKLLVEKVFDPNYPNGRPFLWNCRKGNWKEVDRLLRDERIILQVNRYHYLVRICKYGEVSLLEYLLNHPRINSLKDNSKCLMAVVKMGHMEKIKLLVDRIEIDPDIRFKIMSKACKYNKPQVLKLFLDTSTTTITLAHNIRLIKQCSHIPNEDILLLLISHRCLSLFSQASKKRIYERALEYACSFGFIKIVETILGRNDVDTLEIGIPILSALYRDNACQVVKVLLQFTNGSIRGCAFSSICYILKDPELVKLFSQFQNMQISHKSFAEMICRVGDLELVSQCLHRGEKGEFLKAACSMGKIQIVAFLLKYEDLSTKDMYMSLFLACKEKNIEIVRLLLNDTRVDPTKNGQEILYSACSSQNIELLSLLLSHPKTNLVSLKKDLLPYLVENGKEEVIKLLLNWPSN